MPPSSFQELDFAVSCSERSELWPDDQYSSADGTVCHLAALGLHNLLQRAWVQGKVMGICNGGALLACQENGSLFAAEMENQYSSYVRDAIADRGHFQVLFKQRKKLRFLNSDHLAIYEGNVDISIYIINNNAPFHSDTIALLFASLSPQILRLKFKWSS